MGLFLIYFLVFVIESHGAGIGTRENVVRFVYKPVSEQVYGKKGEATEDMHLPQAVDSLAE